MSRPAQGGASSYRAVLALPRARGLFVAGALARLPYGLLSLPLLLALRQAVGSYTGAGTAFGAFGLVSAVLGPYRARLVERRPVALIWLSGGFATTLAAVALLADRTRLPEGAAIALAVVAGALPPPVGPLLRARWSAMSEGEAQRQAALSLDTVAESTIFATGPMLAGALLAVGTAPAALAVCAATVVVGFAALAALLARIPAVQPADDPATPSSTPEARARVPFRSGAFLSVLAVVLAVGWAIAMAELAVVAAWGAAVSGPLLALLSVGGVVGGLLYGRRSWRWSPRRRLAALGAAGALCHLLPALLFAPGGAAVALLCAGAATDAALITAYLLVDELVPAGARAEGGAWVNTCFNLGVAIGSSVAGLLLGTALGPRGVLAVGAAGAALPVLVLVLVQLLKLGGQRQGPAETGLMTTHQPETAPQSPSQSEPVDLAAALASFDALWSPRIVAAVNDYDVRVAKVQGEYVWHSHADTDEFFLVLDGELTIGLREPAAAERSVTLTRGSVFVVPRGVEHRPTSATGASILLFEPTGTLSSGDYAGEIPDHIDSTTGHTLISG